MKNVPVHLQMELVDLQCDGHLKYKFAEVPLVKFYGEYIPHDQMPRSGKPRTNADGTLWQHIPVHV